jgi:hypothetical protein
VSVILADRPTITLQPPADPELAKLWTLAILKFKARTAALPTMKDEWNQVTREYNALSAKPHGILSQIIRERCEKAPDYD